MSRYDDLTERARKGDLYVRSYSPGDGSTRYRFFRKMADVPESTYFGPESGMYTALGIREAETFVEGFLWGYALDRVTT